MIDSLDLHLRRLRDPTWYKLAFFIAGTEPSDTFSPCLLIPLQILMSFSRVSPP